MNLRGALSCPVIIVIYRVVQNAGRVDLVEELGPRTAKDVGYHAKFDGGAGCMGKCFMYHDLGEADKVQTMRWMEATWAGMESGKGGVRGGGRGRGATHQAGK